MDVSLDLKKPLPHCKSSDGSNPGLETFHDLELHHHCAFPVTRAALFLGSRHAGEVTAQPISWSSRDRQWVRFDFGSGEISCTVQGGWSGFPLNEPKEIWLCGPEELKVGKIVRNRSQVVGWLSCGGYDLTRWDVHNENDQLVWSIHCNNLWVVGANSLSAEHKRTSKQCLFRTSALYESGKAGISYGDPARVISREARSFDIPLGELHLLFCANIALRFLVFHFDYRQ